MKKNMYKIFGAAAIIGLFLLGSVASTSLAAIGGIQTGTQTVEKQVIEDGGRDGEYEGDMYPCPPEWGFDDDELLPYPVPSEAELLGKPEYVVTKIEIERVPTGARFKVTLRNIGKRTNQYSALKVRIPGKLVIPQEFEVPGLFRFQKYEVTVQKALGLPIPWVATGGLVIGQPDCNNEIDEWIDFDVTARYFVSNIIYGIIVPGGSVSEASGSVVSSPVSGGVNAL